MSLNEFGWKSGYNKQQYNQLNEFAWMSSNNKQHYNQLVIIISHVLY